MAPELPRQWRRRRPPQPRPPRPRRPSDRDVVAVKFATPSSREAEAPSKRGRPRAPPRWGSAPLLLLPVVLLAADRAPLRCSAEEQGEATTPVLDWMVSLSGDNHAFPLMDFVASDLEDIDSLVDALEASLAPFEAEAPAVAAIEAMVQQRGLSAYSDDVREEDLANWLLQLNWFGLATDEGPGLRIVAALAEHFTQDVERGGGALCDEADTQEDLAHIVRIHRGLSGLETLPLEDNEFKWAEMFVRKRYRSPFCALGVASLFLVAGDVTAYASSAAGGEHMRRLRRALLFAQGIAREALLAPPPAPPNEGSEAPPRRVRPLDLLRTRWPIWRLLASIQAELQAGRRALPAAPRAPPPAPLAAARLPPDDSELYLTVIVQCRNDDYGGNMLLRLNRMLTTATYMLHEARVPSEIIIVEWNPPVGEAPIADVIERTPGTEGTVAIRVIRVPTEVHTSMPHHKAHPIFEHTAENVAFRRARGRFVLKTNIDNIMSMYTVEFISRGQLREDSIYRAAYLEMDFPSEAEGPKSAPELLEWLFTQPKMLQDSNLELADLSQKYPEDTSICPKGDPGPPSGGQSVVRPFYWAGSGDFVLASRRVLMHVRGYPQIAQNYNTDDLIHCRLRAVGVRQVVLQPPCVTVHQNHRRINRVRASTRWVVTDDSAEKVCASPFDPLPTETGVGEDWGFASMAFEERVV